MSSASASDVFFDLSDRRLRARRFTPEGTAPADQFAPTLVFLHEGLGCVDLWRTFPDALCARTRLRGLAYDRTGYGQSSRWPAPPGVHYLAIESKRVLPELLDAAAIESCLLIGHGDGGTIALRFAASQPPLLRAVVTIGAHAISEARTLASVRHAREAFGSAGLRDALERYHGDNVDGAFAVWNDAWLTPGFAPMDAPASLPRVRVPVLALQGEHDEYGSVAQLHAIARSVSGRCETRQMTGCGYAPHLQDEPTVVEAVARFVSTLWRGPGDGGRAARAVLLALACTAAGAGPAMAQPDPCATREAEAVLSDARRDLDRADDDGAAARLRAGAERPGDCHEIGVAALAVDGWVEARRLATVGGPPGQLGRMKDTLARLDAVRAARARTSILAQLAAYADAVLRAAVAAAQDERDEMQVYLAHARTLADTLALARIARPWPLPIDLVGGELWLEVDRFGDARDALARVTDDALAARAAVGTALALERLNDRGGACAALRRAAAGALAAAVMERVRTGLVRLECAPR